MEVNKLGSKKIIKYARKGCFVVKQFNHQTDNTGKQCKQDIHSKHAHIEHTCLMYPDSFISLGAHMGRRTLKYIGSIKSTQNVMSPTPVIQRYAAGGSWCILI